MSIEQIGSVVIDTSRWPGIDTYSDGPIEQEILARLANGESALEILKSDTRYPILYHFSRERENLISWYPFDKDANVLEVGAGCGALTGLLVQKCASVTAVDLSLTRCRINAYRNKSAINLKLLVMNIQEIPEEPKFDVITVIGVLEYGRIFFSGDTPFQAMLQLLYKKLKPNGKLLIAIENQFGLKYFLGAREDHNWKLFGGLEGYSPTGPITFSKMQLTELLKESGFEYNRFFYPYPDYKFPRQIFSDGGEYLYESIGGECPDYGEYVYRASNQSRIFRAAAKGGLMKELSNSFLVCCSKENDIDQSIKFVQYASLRDYRFALKTIICDEKEGTFVYKYPLYPNGKEGINNIRQGAQILQNKLVGGEVASFESSTDYIKKIYYAGTSYSMLLNSANASQRELLLQTYRHMFDRLVMQEPISFTEDLSFKAVYGEIEAPRMICVNPSPIDINFDNVIKSDESLVIIDTEWVFEFPLPLGYIMWRALQLFCEKDEGEKAEYLEQLGVAEQYIPLYEKMEQAFRNYAFPSDSMFTINNRYKKQVNDVMHFDRIQKQLVESYRRISELEKENNDAWAQLTQKDEGEKILKAELIDSFRRIGELEEESKEAWAQIKQKSNGEEMLNERLTESYRRIRELENEAEAAWAQIKQKSSGEEMLNERLTESYRRIRELENEAEAAWAQIKQKADGEKILNERLAESYRRISDLENEAKAVWGQLNQQKMINDNLVYKITAEREKYSRINKEYISVITKYENMFAVKIARKLKQKASKNNPNDL